MGRLTVLNSITGGARRLLPLAAVIAAAASSGCAASTKGEVQMGQQAAAQATHSLPMVTDPDINRYITVLGDSLAAVADTRDLEWHFYVVDSPEINAFALPGGFVFVNRGLIERVDSLDELAGVIGHEIGHVTQRHKVKLQQKGEIAQIGTGLACVLTRACTQAAGVGINAGEGAMFAKFSRDAEHEADSVGMIYVVKAGIDPRGMTSMFEKLLAERQRSPEKLEAWFITHPMEEDRIGFTLDAIDKMDRKQLEALTRDTPNFRKFKLRFDALPPYPPQPAN
jgi:predicted Zn-dependent protease